MKISVVILNWNTQEYLKQFIPGILRSCHQYGDAELVVADNGSTDGSLEMMAEHFPEVRCIALERNLGFTGGYNEALRDIESQYAVLLNSDVEVTGDWLTPLSQWLDAHPQCGAVGPKLKSFADREMFEYAGAAGGMLDAFGYPFCRGRVPGRIEKDLGQYDAAPEDVFWLSGACLMVRMELWRKLGGLDERFFAHMEEIDWCWRAQLSGYDITFIPDATVYHIGGGTLENTSPTKLMLNFRNSLLMLENNLAKTIVAEGKSVDKALRISESRLFQRRLLDTLSFVVYLFTLKFKSAGAVIRAHNQFRKLRRAPTAESLLAWDATPHRHGSLKGVYVGSIILGSIRHYKI